MHLTIFPLLSQPYLFEKPHQRDAIVAAEPFQSANRDVAAARFDQADVQPRGPHHVPLQLAPLHAQGDEFLGDPVQRLFIKSFLCHLLPPLC